MTAAAGPTLLIANLACEVELARAASDAAPALPPHVTRAISAIGTLMRALASPGDVLWTPAPVSPERLPELPGLPVPRLVSGPLTALDAARFATIIAWGETRAVAALRGEDVDGRALAFANASHRSFHLELATRQGCALPGARMVRSVDALAAHLADGGARAAGDSGWVLKGARSAAGRERHLSRRAALSRRDRERAATLIAAHGEVLFEPWLPRTLDVGVSAELTPDGARIVQAHTQRVDGYGRFAALTLPPADTLWPTALRPEERAALEQAVERTGGSLTELGYTGAFGIDAWRWRDLSGTERFHPLGELNPRFTLGRVADAVATRLRGAGALPPEAPLTLCTGRGGPTPASAQSAEVVPLLLPHADDPTAAWLELDTPIS